MAIRLRVIDGYLIAICAARSMPKEGDVYLDDAAHHALTIKFGIDHSGEGQIGPWLVAEPEVPLMEREESNNPARAWWDKTYGNRKTEGGVTIFGGSRR